MRGLDIIARTLSVPVAMGQEGTQWQYHGRSDRHSKVACWCILFDLLSTSSLLAKHVGQRKACFGINHTMGDFRMDRRKSLDLVVCTPGSAPARRRDPKGFVMLAREYKLQ